MKQLLLRSLKVCFGLFLFSFGYYLSIQANIGLAPWSAFGIGISGITGISFGAVTILTSIAIVVIDLVLREKIGIGTVLDAFLVGIFVDLFIYLDLIPMLKGFVPGVVLLLFGQLVVSIGSYFYISPGLGCGPRDALMVAIGKRMPKAPIGLVRIIIEGAALFIGWICGAKVGVGTIIAVFGIGFMIDMIFRLFRFDVKAVVNEDVITSFKSVLKK